MSENINIKLDSIFVQIGEFGLYQCLMYIIVGSTAFAAANVAFSFSFYAAVPHFRYYK